MFAAALAVVAGAVPAVAYEEPSSAGTGQTGLNGFRVIPFPSGLTARGSVTGNNDVQEGLTLSSIGSPQPSHYQPQVDPARAYAIKVQSLPIQNCPAFSTCPTGTVTLAFSRPVRDPIVNVSGLGAGVNANGQSYGDAVQLTLTSSDRPVTLAGVSPGSTLRLEGRTIKPAASAPRANCSDANPALRAGCGSLQIRGVVQTLTFATDMVTQDVPVASNATTNGRDAWALSSVVQDDCSNAPTSYGNASHVVSDLSLGATVTPDVPGTAITQACRASGDDNDLNPDFGGLNSELAGKPYSLTVPVQGVSAGAFAAAWIDFTGGGTFTDAQRATARVAPGATSVTFTWTVPAGVKAGPTWSRFRLGYNQAPVESATGMADSGEVEDWPLQITGPAALSLQKTGEPTTVGQAGDTVQYTYKVTNTGDVPVTDVRIDETSFSGTGTAPQITCPAGTVAPGDSVTCTATYTVTQADVDAGKITNTATATATPPAGMNTPTSGESTATVDAPARPGLLLHKAAAEEGALKAGEVLHYSFDVTNTGNVTMTGVAIRETGFTGSGPAPTVTCPDAAKSLAPGAKVTCTATYTVTQADVDRGSVRNTAVASGSTPTGQETTSDPSTVTVPFAPAPGLRLDKTVDPATYRQAGQTLTYTFHVTNTGNVTMTGVTVTEGSFSGTGALSGVTCPPDQAAALAPGARMDCTATYTVTQADVDAGKLDNSATATGTPPGGGGPVTSPPGTSSVPAESEPALTVDKSTDQTELVAGETVTYHFTVTNTGNVTLTNVAVGEGEWTGSGPAPTATCPDAAKSLAPGAQVVCTATYTVTQADADRGTLRNTATATATPPGGGTPVTSPPSTVQLPHDSRPALTIAKKADPATAHQAGDTITFAYTVTNTGNVTLTDVHPVEGAFSGTGTISAITCPDTAKSLVPGMKVVCTATYRVTQADVDAGKLDNAATATGTPPGGGTPATSPPSSAEVSIPPAPALTVAKTADTNDLTAGETITYSFTVTNTGNVTLTDVTIGEGEWTGSGRAPQAVCPAAARSLAPGAQVVCTAAYTVTQADADRGSLRNTATAGGTPPHGGPVTSPPSTVQLPHGSRPALTVAKSADPATVRAAGAKVTFSYTVTNTGNVTLTDVHPVEGVFTGTGTISAITCPDTAKSLAPGATVVCTATYQVTPADAAAGGITNTATATATGPDGTPATSAPSTTTVHVEPAPPAPPHGQLPQTGAGTGLAGPAVALSVGGTALVLLAGYGRRRRRG
ncbi:GEVED domain-containing protein [Kitasatospora sp. NPDC036755]|uniref:DUF7507 domain-containing protein n=1 Tax=Kitasatospora sp. NPDC036755 TaxID=3154600 RepID=UPI0033DEF7BF